MKTSNRLILSTSPLSQPTRKPRVTGNLSPKQRTLYGRRRRYPTGKERDSETGLYYYGARYLDSRTGRWISGDPAMGEYVPSAPVNDEARKRNGNLPGQGGVFNYVNLHAYHYAGNNPVKYIDPNGEYDRAAAVVYAKQWAFDHNPKYYRYKTDCANFVSQSLFAGGIKMNASWYSNSKGIQVDDFGLYNMSTSKWDIASNWRLAANMLNYFSDPQNGYASEMVTVDKNNISTAANDMGIQVGDIMFFAGEDGNNPHHAAIITKIENGELFYSAHTENREDRSLSKSIGDEQVRIVKIRDDAE